MMRRRPDVQSSQLGELKRSVAGTRSSGSLRVHEVANRAGLSGRGRDGHSCNPAAGFSCGVARQIARLLS